MYCEKLCGMKGDALLMESSRMCRFHIRWNRSHSRSSKDLYTLLCDQLLDVVAGRVVADTTEVLW